MTRLMIVVGSVRPGRIGLPIAEWVRAEATTAGFEVDFVDLLELDLPFMDEPNHPAQRRYTKPHTIAWSDRVEAVQAVLFVTPEYNHGYAPALKNALDYLAQEWRRKPVAFVSYGGVSAGTRALTALAPVLAVLGMTRTLANLELPFAGQSVADGVFSATEAQQRRLGQVLAELAALAG